MDLSTPPRTAQKEEAICMLLLFPSPTNRYLDLKGILSFLLLVAPLPHILPIKTFHFVQPLRAPF